MSVMEIGQKMVAAVNAGRDAEHAFVVEFYDDKIASIEGQGSVATGLYCGHRDDQFVVRFNLDTTPTGGERSQMEEAAIYTVASGKIVQEEYLYLMG